MIHKANVIFLSETKCSCLDSLQKVVFFKFDYVLAKSKEGGLLLMWDETINLKVVIANKFMIKSIIF